MRIKNRISHTVLFIIMSFASTTWASDSNTSYMSRISSWVSHIFSSHENTTTQKKSTANSYNEIFQRLHTMLDEPSPGTAYSIAKQAIIHEEVNILQKALIRLDANFEQTQTFNISNALNDLILFAIQNRYLDAINILIKKEKTSCNDNPLDPSYLFTAVANDDTKAIQLLLENGATPDIQVPYPNRSTPPSRWPHLAEYIGLHNKQNALETIILYINRPEDVHHWRAKAVLAKVRHGLINNTYDYNFIIHNLQKTKNIHEAKKTLYCKKDDSAGSDINPQYKLSLYEKILKEMMNTPDTVIHAKDIFTYLLPHINVKKLESLPLRNLSVHSDSPLTTLTNFHSLLHYGYTCKQALNDAIRLYQSTKDDNEHANPQKRKQDKWNIVSLLLSYGAGKNKTYEQRKQQTKNTSDCSIDEAPKKLVDKIQNNQNCDDIMNNHYVSAEEAALLACGQQNYTLLKDIVQKHLKENTERLANILFKLHELHVLHGYPMHPIKELNIETPEIVHNMLEITKNAILKDQLNPHMYRHILTQYRYNENLREIATNKPPYQLIYNNRFTPCFQSLFTTAMHKANTIIKDNSYASFQENASSPKPGINRNQPCGLAVMVSSLANNVEPIKNLIGARSQEWITQAELQDTIACHGTKILNAHTPHTDNRIYEDLKKHNSKLYYDVIHMNSVMQQLPQCNNESFPLELQSHIKEYISGGLDQL